MNKIGCNILLSLDKDVSVQGICGGRGACSDSVKLIFVAVFLLAEYLLPKPRYINLATHYRGTNSVKAN
jgi:hypothetical protein